MKKKFIVEYRYVGTDEMWRRMFHNGEWHKWSAYKKERDAANAIQALRKNKKLPWEKKSKLEYRHAPNP